MSVIVESAVARSVVLSPYDEPPELGRREGYILVNLDVGGTAPSIDFVRNYKVGQAYLEGDEEIRLSKNHRYSVSLKGKSKGLYLMAMPVGLYQITQINAPYFNLPYQLDTGDKRVWRFCVDAQKVNYIGRLFINKQRKSDTIEVYLKNRMAADLGEIQDLLGVLIEQYPLVSGAGVQDVFYREWLAPVEVKQ
ncbi:hypothetical protein MO867_14380 [Microbulbifer sp. OS29]|uniref:Uncharacterized protein n=1 Tax=Microbulbifer okhotskensis TaxID=2926617 RepID=A0A9X2ETY4_9GAMM|nr:hypothetical protein [Microbulbifer okhotskensis]MCO1335523.1 hypothetical protein [Microbulbifer okhotskensis]